MSQSGAEGRRCGNDPDGDGDGDGDGDDDDDSGNGDCDSSGAGSANRTPPPMDLNGGGGSPQSTLAARRNKPPRECEDSAWNCSTTAIAVAPGVDAAAPVTRNSVRPDRSPSRNAAPPSAAMPTTPSAPISGRREAAVDGVGAGAAARRRVK
jgi:hypothetical protein